MKHIPHIKSIITLLVGSAILCSFNNTVENTPAAYYTNIRDTLPCFLAISDIHLHAGLSQAEAECKGGDSGDSLWKAAEDKICSLTAQKHPGFLIVLGDLPFHKGCNGDTSMNHVHNSFNTVCKNLEELENQVNIPIIVVPGNNDAWDGDYAKLDSSHFPFFYPNNASVWADSSAKNLGCYSVYPLGKNAKLRIIVLNTTIFSSHPGYGASKNADADTVINWLGAQLEDAKNGQVIIAMHIPPGIDGYNGASLWDSTLKYDAARSVQDAFLDIIDSFKANIIGLLASHSHMDGIRLLVDDNKINNSKIAALLISIPGIAPGHGNNPAVKLIEYDPAQNDAITNFTTYYMQYWNDTNYWGKQDKLPAWNDSFSFRTAFNPPLTGNNLFDDIKTKTLLPGLLMGYVDNIYTAYGKENTEVTKSIAFIDSSVYVTKFK
jgi:sphingomyelin phosphodiesterase acid-like 3